LYYFSFRRISPSTHAMSQETQYWYLRNHKLFSVLSNAQIDDLCIMTRYKRAEKGEIIYFADEPEKRIFILKKGAIKICENDGKGNEVVKELLMQGDLFGEISLDQGKGGSEYAQALSKDVIICSFRLADFEYVLENNPDIALKYTKLVGFKFKKLKNSYNNLFFKDVKTRLITFLIDWAEREGEKIGDEIFLKNYLTHQDIAGVICSTRQTVTQLLNELEEEKLISYGRKDVVFRDIERMRKTA
jgi:CRP-like cAMP-binding protein